MRKIALVLGGGGMKGAYELGVWKALRELGIQPQVITGTSIGALNGALMVQDDFDFACTLWDSICYDMIFQDKEHHGIEEIDSRLQLVELALRNAIWKGGLDVTPLKGLLEQNLDEEKIRQSPIAFGMVTTEIVQNQKKLLQSIPTLKKLTMMKEDIPKGQMVDYLMASAACFPIFQPQKIGDSYHLDGGYVDDLPIDLAETFDPDEIIAVDLESLGMKQIKMPKRARLRYIRSKWPLGELFCFKRDIVNRNIHLGYYDCMKEYGRYDGSLYTFYLGEVEKLLVNPNQKPDTQKQLSALFQHQIKSEKLTDKVYQKLQKLMIPEKKNPILSMAESAGKIFEITPDRIYTAREFQYLMMERYCDTVSNLPIIDKENLIPSLKALLKNMDTKILVSALVELSLAEDFDLKKWEGLYGIPEVVPAALYILELLSNNITLFP